MSFNGGRGVGRYEGVVVFVPWTAPGDRVRVQIKENKKTFLIAEIDEILVPSQHRRSAQCPVFGRCGGCAWQHVSYSEQLNQKNLILRSVMKKWDVNEPFEWREFLPSPDEFRYRNRIQVNKQEKSVGFYARSSRDIVNISDCPITELELAQRIPTLHEQPNGRYEISRRTDGRVEIASGLRSPEAALFSQVNSRQNETMIAMLLEWSRELRFTEIWDLYCGSGNLTWPLAETFESIPITGVELSADAIQLAQKSVQSSQVRWVAQDVARFLSSQQKKVPGLFIVLDPPRIGVDQSVITQMGRLQPEFVIYVSCNPMTFFRDACRLKTLGFTLDRVQGFDMFPQTEHVELMSLFRRVISR